VKQDIAPRVASAGLQLSYSAQSSVQSELARETFADVTTVALSYLAMFLYMAVALSRGPIATSPEGDLAQPSGGKRRLLELATTLGSRAALAAVGVCVVGASVMAALGLCSIMGIPATLIMMEVCCCMLAYILQL
jgi:Niemann-Pick C1 protein